MVDWEHQRRFPVVCTRCGSVYVGLERRDGEITPIGNGNECQCGGDEFEPVEDAAGADSSENATCD